MSRLLQVVLALVGLAITGVLGLASERSEALQARHTLIGLFTETVSAARTTCDGGLSRMAQGALDQLVHLENAPRLLMTETDKADRAETQELLAEYQDIMAQVQGTIDSGGCLSAGTMMAMAAAPGASGPTVAAAAPPPSPVTSTAPPAAAQPPTPAQEALAQASSNIALRRVESAVVAERRARAPASTRAAGVAEQGFVAVLASYGVEDASTYDPARGVVADYRRLRQLVEGAGVNLRVYQTSISNHYAIALAPDGLDRGVARTLVEMARTRGWSTDAFVQAAAEWTPCAEPETISPERPCR